MRFNPTEPPREFDVGRTEIIRLKDCAHLDLAHDEQVTFHTETGGEYDVVRKSWGFYATPSLNSRLQRFGLRGVLVRNLEDQYFLLLVERGKEVDFDHYVAIEDLAIVSWMDDTESLKQLDQAVSGGQG